MRGSSSILFGYLATSAVLTPAAALAQAADERTAKNSVYLELLGPAVFYSVNYDRFFGDDVAGRVGAGFIGLRDGSQHLTVPLTFSYLGIGSRTNMFELGGGVTLALSNREPVLYDRSGPGLLASAILGYRYQPPRGGFTLRVGASPVASFRRVLPWAYVSLGGAF